MRHPFKGFNFMISWLEHLWCLVSVWDAKDLTECNSLWQMNDEEGKVDPKTVRNWLKCHSVSKLLVNVQFTLKFLKYSNIFEKRWNNTWSSDWTVNGSWVCLQRRLPRQEIIISTTLFSVLIYINLQPFHSKTCLRTYIQFSIITYNPSPSINS